MQRKIPDYIDSYGKVASYKDISSIKIKSSYERIYTSNKNINNKVVGTIKEALIKSDIKDGDTISFHHHLRNGDYVLNIVMNEIANLGIRNINLCVSSLLNIHAPLIDHIKNGVVTKISTSGIRGELGREISYNNILKSPVIFRSHGGRARAVSLGIETIDIAFIGASSCDVMGNMNGKSGKSKFGSMGYGIVDADYGKKVVAITDNIVPYPLASPSINQTKVDFVVFIDEIGNPDLISSGATRVTNDERSLKIAKYTADVLIKSGYIKNDFSYQAGSGSSSLAVINYLKDYMMENNIVGSFASGGITSVLTELLEEGYFKKLLDTQTFDNQAVTSLEKNPNHIEMSSDMYANPFNKGAVCNMLDIMILSATEVDLDFNINVLTGSDGVIMGAQGGHPDTAESAKLKICTIPLVRKTIPIIIEEVTTLVTRGEFVDIVVTDYGIAINPKRTDLINILKDTALPIMSIKSLYNIAKELTGIRKKPKFNKDIIVGVVESRNGTVIDVCYKVEKEVREDQQTIFLDTKKEPINQLPLKDEYLISNNIDEKKRNFINKDDEPINTLPLKNEYLIYPSNSNQINDGDELLKNDNINLNNLENNDGQY